ncbi:MAG: RidA family protein [Nocardioides sp.]|uniref:RidA family protein n=1 Tax=Nocardioides sp. TaxID=35761 RepID=UPI003D6AA92F
MSTDPAVVHRDHADGVPRSYLASATHGGVVWACGQVPRRADGSVPGSIEEQVGVTIDNLEAVLRDAGASLATVLKMTVFLADLDEFDSYDAAYRARLDGNPLPPRTTVQVARFRGEKRIEIDAVAAVVREPGGPEDPTEPARQKE